MSIPATSLSSISPVGWPSPSPSLAPARDSGFQDLLAQTIRDTQALGNESQNRIEHSLISNDLSMVETFTAMREADVALKLMLQIRNKLVDAYQELQQIRF